MIWKGLLGWAVPSWAGNGVGFGAGVGMGVGVEATVGAVGLDLATVDDCVGVGLGALEEEAIDGGAL